MLELNKENFEEQVLNSQGLVLVDFWSPKCEPCMELMPHVTELAGKYKGVKFGKVNILENRRLAIGQKVLGLPTILIYKDGEKVAELSKDFTIEDVETTLKEQLG
ncbi:MAG: thioredoxin [Firmicutes bacterium]|nr:thioredoxin [Bacillota bacterium]